MATTSSPLPDDNFRDLAALLVLLYSALCRLARRCKGLLSLAIAVGRHCIAASPRHRVAEPLLVVRGCSATDRLPSARIRADLCILDLSVLSLSHLLNHLVFRIFSSSKSWSFLPIVSSSKSSHPTNHPIFSHLVDGRHELARLCRLIMFRRPDPLHGLGGLYGCGTVCICGRCRGRGWADAEVGEGRRGRAAGSMLEVCRRAETRREKGHNTKTTSTTLVTVTTTKYTTRTGTLE